MRMRQEIIKAKYEDEVGLITMWLNKYEDGHEDYAVTVIHNDEWRKRNGLDISNYGRRKKSEKITRFADRTDAERNYHLYSH